MSVSTIQGERKLDQNLLVPSQVRKSVAVAGSAALLRIVDAWPQ